MFACPPAGDGVRALACAPARQLSGRSSPALRSLLGEGGGHLVGLGDQLADELVELL